MNTHADTHVAAAIDHNGGVLGVQDFSADEAGYGKLLVSFSEFGDLDMIGVEGTGSWGIGLTRFPNNAGVGVVEVDRPNRLQRRRQGKSDPTDAISAARAAPSGTATPKPRSMWPEDEPKAYPRER